MPARPRQEAPPPGEHTAATSSSASKKHQVKDFSKTRRGQYLQHREGAPVGGGTPAATSANKPHLEKVLFKTRKGLHLHFVPDPNLDQWINSEVKHDKLTGKHVKHTGEMLNKAERDAYTQYRHRHVARCRLGDERTMSLIGGTTPLTPRRTQSRQTQPLVPHKGGCSGFVALGRQRPSFPTGGKRWHPWSTAERTHNGAEAIECSRGEPTTPTMCHSASTSTHGKTASRTGTTTSRTEISGAFARCAF